MGIMKYIKKYKKELAISVSVLVVLAIIGFVVKMKHHSNAEAPSTPETGVFNALQVTEQPKTISGKKKVTSPVATPEISYTEAYTKYKDGHVLQFNEQCQAFPKTMSIANKSVLMLDNRSSHDEVIKIGENAYQIPAYGFKIVNLDIAKIPATFTVDCLKSQNVNTLIVE